MQRWHTAFALVATIAGCSPQPKPPSPPSPDLQSKSCFGPGAEPEPGVCWSDWCPCDPQCWRNFPAAGGFGHDVCLYIRQVRGTTCQDPGFKCNYERYSLTCGAD